MRASLNNLTILHDSDHIGVLNSGETMSNTNDSLITRSDKLINGLLDKMFTLGIKCRSSLIKQQKLWFSDQGPSNSNSLLLATGKFYASLTNQCIKALRELVFILNELEAISLSTCFFELFCGDFLSWQTIGNVILDASGEEYGFLRNDSNLLFEPLWVQLLDIDTVK